MDIFRRILDLFRHVLEFLGWRRPKARPIALEASPFRKLPLELIFLIASYLPLESAALLGLSCYSLYSCLKMECLHPLKEAEYSVKNAFLSFLERDLPTHLLCPHCNKLHSMSFSEGHLPSRRYLLTWKNWHETCKPWLVCWSADYNSCVERGIYPDFSSTVFRMAMKAHRQGHDTTKLLGLLSYKKHIIQPGFVEQRATAVRIRDGSLLAREQRVFMFPSSRKIPLPPYDGIEICRHICSTTLRSVLGYDIRVPNADEIKRHRNREGIIYCRYCYTEFQVDFKSYGEAGNAMFITKWMDIGEGRAISDHKWRSRVGHKGEHPWTRIMFRRGSICAAFEQKARFKFYSLLTPQDEKDLCRWSLWSWLDRVDDSHDERHNYHYNYYGVRHGRILPNWETRRL